MSRADLEACGEVGSGVKTPCDQTCGFRDLSHLQMLLNGIRRMFCLCCGQRWKHRLLPVALLWLLAAAPSTAADPGYFLGDTKAVLNGCEDHWTLQTPVPELFQITVCVDIRVVDPGPWVAFSYSLAHAPRPELGLEGDQQALYVWLLRFRHRFPLRLALTDWHRVCLRWDARSDLFSLEVDGDTVTERTVIAQAIPPSGSLWLGCQPRGRPRGPAPGAVELYLFRMWEDLGSHGPCEDGSLIGWDVRSWGLTSARARQRDPHLQCASVGQMLMAGTVPSTTVTPAATPDGHMTAQTGSSTLSCVLSHLCSSKDAYFWTVLSVEAAEGDKTEEDVQNLVSDVFSCLNPAGFTDFCQDDQQLQVVQVTCRDKHAIRNTTCELLLRLSHARPACELRRAALSALQNSGERQIRARIQGEVERVGRDLCGSAAPPSGRFVRCAPASSLEELCRATEAPQLTCSAVEPDWAPVPQSGGESCSAGTPPSCDCTTLCNSTSQFFALEISIDDVDVAFLKNLLSEQNVAGMCPKGSRCQDISKHYKDVYVKCQETLRRLLSCTVMLEMLAPVNSCTLGEILQQLINRNAGIRSTRPLTRMVVCRRPGSSLHSLLTSNLTWVSDLPISDVCEPGEKPSPCHTNQFAVLLNDGCRPPSQQSPTTVTPAPVASTTRLQATPTPEIGSSRPTTAQPVDQTVPERTTSHNVSSAPTGSPRSRSAAGATAGVGSTLNTTTAAPGSLMNFATTAGALKSPNHTNLDRGTTATSFPEGTEGHHVATDEDVSPNNATDDTVATTTTTGTTAAHNQSRKDYFATVTSPSNQNVSTTTDTYKSENGFTADDNRNHHNHTNRSRSGAEGRTTTGTTASNANTAGNDGTALNTVTTGSTNTALNHTTASYDYTTQHGPTDSLKTHTSTTGPFPPDYNTTGDNNFTPDHNRTAMAANTYATASHKDTTEFSNTADGSATDTFTPSNDYTNINNMTTASGPNADTAVPPNEAVTASFTTSAFRDTQQAALSTTASGVSTVGDAAAVTQTSAQSTVPLLHTLTTPVTHSVTPSDRASTPANAVATVGSGSSAANASQTTTKDPAVVSSVGHLATPASNSHGPHSSQVSITIATLPLASPTTTVASATKPGTTQTSSGAATKSIRAREEQANKLLDQSRRVSQLNSSQVSQLAEQLEELLEGPTVSQAVGRMALNIISNLMDGDAQALSASANRLIRVVDDLGVKLVVTGDSEVVSSNWLVLAVRKVGSRFPLTSVDIYGTDNVQFGGWSRSRSEGLGSALASVFLPASLSSGLSLEQRQQARRVQFSFYTKPTLFLDPALDNQTLVGPVLGSSVANLSISNLTVNIEFTIRTMEPAQAPETASCAFWDFSLNGGGGGWSSAGCFLLNATPDATTCSCNHLTSFAILLDLSRQGLPDHQQARALTFITYIGCGISAVFLAATLLTYLSLEKLLRDIPAKILVQLCVSLLLLNLLFLLDGWLARNPSGELCISTAFFLHYFLLSSFTWAGLEALHMYLSVVQVFLPYLSRYMLKVSLVGWGLPLLVVIVTVSVDKDNYGLVSYSKDADGTSDHFCWLRNDVAFYAAVVAYFLLVFALCLLVFIMVMVQLARIKRQNPHNQSPSRGVLTDVRSISGLVVLLGLTWGFALFAWGPLRLPFIYLFSIFNSLQGFIVFVFHCAVKENVRRQWRTHLCCGRLRLVEHSEWSRTATRSNRHAPAAAAPSWAPHFASRSSSVISDGTSNGGSVFADSGISDCCSNDVILNEIHRNQPL